MISYKICIIDDEEFIRSGLAMTLEGEYEVFTFSSAETALPELRNHNFDLILLDIGLPGMNGIDALAAIKSDYPDILVIMITAYEDINMVIAAMKNGAHDYVIKPLEMESLEIKIRNALETIRLRKEVYNLQERFLEENLPCFIGESNAIRSIMDFITTVAKSPDTPILILGETGTGKELLAQAVHYRSPNFKGPFVTLNCGAIPEHLVESELFGYEKGAFSGANTQGKKGLVEEAAGGTLFLDEVGDLDQAAQAKLLRFLENGEYYRLGGTKKVKVQTRIVSATNRDLKSMMADGTFRRDLYYRLAVLKVDVPSLNKRRDDIIPIAKHFLVDFAKKHNKDIEGFSAQAGDALKYHHWEGNVRQLRNVIERGVLLSQTKEIGINEL
ncbi:MAG: sigma-54 dependent transcriptional regulator, partial [Desulfobulbaceae bacterium]|nr:sigma-54 dependent transcriptional regulator [Desulfobulbaceae bacterium]